MKKLLPLILILFAVPCFGDNCYGTERTRENLEKDKIIKFTFFGSLILIALVYGLGRLIACIFL